MKTTVNLKYFDNFVTKYNGFTYSEINELLKYYPNINTDKFNSCLYGISCSIVNEEIVIYKHDVKLALICGIENRDLTEFEFD